MSKEQKILGFSCDAQTLPGHIVVPMCRGPYLNIYKDEPGVLHLLMQTRAGVLGCIRYVYAGDALTKTPKPNKPDVRCTAIKAGYDTLYTIVGTYTGDFDGGDTKLVDHLLTILGTNETPMSYHDKDGFTLLKVKNWYQFNRRRADDWSEETSVFGPVECDMTIECYGIRKDDYQAVAIVNAASILMDLVNVTYYPKTHGWERYDGDIDAGIARKLLTAPAIRAVLDGAEEVGIASEALDTFTTNLLYRFTSSEDDGRKAGYRYRLSRGCTV